MSLRKNPQTFSTDGTPTGVHKGNRPRPLRRTRRALPGTSTTGVLSRNAPFRVPPRSLMNPTNVPTPTMNLNAETPPSRPLKGPSALPLPTVNAQSQSGASESASLEREALAMGPIPPASHSGPRGGLDGEEKEIPVAPITSVLDPRPAPRHNGNRTIPLFCIRFLRFPSFTPVPFRILPFTEMNRFRIQPGIPSTSPFTFLFHLHTLPVPMFCY